MEVFSLAPKLRLGGFAVEVLLQVSSVVYWLAMGTRASERRHPSGALSVPRQLAEALHADLMGAYEYLPARDLKVLRDWHARPSGA
jgi:hypothetical protein